MNKRLTDKQYWDSDRGLFRPFRVEGTAFDKILKRVIPSAKGRTVIEVGAYPGAYLLAISRAFDLRATAVEYSDHAEDIAALFEYNDCPRPEVLKQDFFELDDRQFDFVTSFGFVEHFDELGPVLAKHVQLVAEGGYLIMSVPYLGGWQGLLRRLVYTDRELRRVWMSHNTDIMRLEVLCEAVQAQGMDLLFGDFVMKGQVWIDPASDAVKAKARWLVKFGRLLNRMVLRWLPSSRHWSPMILVVARKTE